MVVHIDDQGYLWFEPIGGWDPCVVLAAAGLLAAFARRVTAATDFVPG